MKIQFRVSKKGVPHTIIKNDDKFYSVCYFGKGGFYRVWDYITQEKIKDVKVEKGELIDLLSLIS